MHTAYYLKLLKSLTYSEHSILRLLKYTVTLSIAKILHNFNLNSKSFSLILVVLSYCGISNMVSRRPSVLIILIQTLFCLLLICFSFILYLLLSNHHIHFFYLCTTRGLISLINPS